MSFKNRPKFSPPLPTQYWTIRCGLKQKLQLKFPSICLAMALSFVSSSLSLFCLSPLSFVSLSLYLFLSLLCSYPLSSSLSLALYLLAIVIPLILPYIFLPHLSPLPLLCLSSSIISPYLSFSSISPFYLSTSKRALFFIDIITREKSHNYSLYETDRDNRETEIILQAKMLHNRDNTSKSK